MKKILALTLAVLMLLCLGACSQNDGNATTTTALVPQPTPVEGYYFTYQNVKLIPGDAWDDSKLPEVEVFENPNCAGEGVFYTHLHDALELTIQSNGQSSVIYSVYLTDANIATPEGLHLGDDGAAVTAAYGDGAITEDGELLTYIKGNTHLVIRLENDVVTSIEYRMAQ